MKIISFTKITAFILLLSAISFISCRKEPVLAPGTAHVSFDQVQSIVQNNCSMQGSGSGCHLAGGEAMELISYENIKSIVIAGKPNKSKFYNVITSKGFVLTSMPPKPYSKLSVAQINLITIWILQGAEKQ